MDNSKMGCAVEELPEVSDNPVVDLAARRKTGSPI
jgi:hypothetical protein